MSYSRSFQKTIHVHYSGSVSYPASEHGGSVSYSGTASETVTVNIEVDTDPFESSVGRCNGNVGLLTGSIVATEAAQIKAIGDSSRRIGTTIVKGFFDTVSSEISQQITELKSRVEATLLRLNEMAKRCVDKQRQMQVDYERISSRYLKIFEDLNNETERRIYELDRPAFVFKRTTDETSQRAIGNDMVSTATVSGAENCSLEARIGVSLVKKRAVEALGRVNDFLTEQRRTDNVLARSIVGEEGGGVYYVPVCYVETRAAEIIDRKLYKPSVLSGIGDSGLAERIRRADPANLLDGVPDRMRTAFNQEVSSRYAAADAHGIRVRDYVTRLFNSNINK